jgi:hypothetical protein
MVHSVGPHSWHPAGSLGAVGRGRRHTYVCRFTRHVYGHGAYHTRSLYASQRISLRIRMPPCEPARASGSDAHTRYIGFFDFARWPRYPGGRHERGRRRW